jgi:hypothetical protein
MLGRGHGVASGMNRTMQSSSLRNRPRPGCEIPCGELPDSICRRNIGNSTHHAVALALEVVRTIRNQAAGAAVWAESGSRRLLGHFVQEGLPLVSGQELEEP